MSAAENLTLPEPVAATTAGQHGGVMDGSAGPGDEFLARGVDGQDGHEGEAGMMLAQHHEQEVNGNPDGDADVVGADASALMDTSVVAATQDNNSNDPTGAGGGGAGQAPVPAAFPRKRRGRPPGRPNQTVREEEYENDPLVQTWNAARSTQPMQVYSVLMRDALTYASLVHETQRAIYQLPSCEVVYFVHGWITARHIASQRPSYVNGLLIHSRGRDAEVSCLSCAERREKNALGPFLTCRVLPGSYHNSCSNCKWFDNTSSCSLYTGPKPNRKRKSKAGAAEEEEGADGDAAAAGGSGAGPKPKKKRSKKQSAANAAAAAAASAQVAAAAVAANEAAAGIEPEQGSLAMHSLLQPPAPMDDVFDLSALQDNSMVDPRLTAGGEDDEDDGNADAQLAAQLLPEIQRHEAGEASDGGS